MKKQEHVLVAAVIGVFAALSLALTTDQILHRVYDAANTALRVNVVAGGGGGGGGAPSGAAGGDLGGTYPNPTLKDCGANEILQRNAGDTAWECAALAGGGGITSGTSTIASGLDTAICYDAAGVIKCDGTSPLWDPGTVTLSFPASGFILGLNAPAATNGGDLQVYAGSADGTADIGLPGSLYLKGGEATAGTENGGNVTIQGGDSSGGTRGTVNITDPVLGGVITAGAKITAPRFVSTEDGSDATDAPFATPTWYVLTDAGNFGLWDLPLNRLVAAFSSADTIGSVFSLNSSDGSTGVQAFANDTDAADTDLLSIPSAGVFTSYGSDTLVGSENGSLRFFAGGVASTNEYWKILDTGVFEGTQSNSPIRGKTAVDGGQLTLHGGNATAGIGGAVVVVGADGTSGGVGGDVTLTAGAGDGVAGGNAIINAGDGTPNGKISFTVSDTEVYRITDTGHLESKQAAPAVSNTSANSCGTSAATLAGTDSSGKVTVGATAGTSCTVTFTSAWSNAPACHVTNETTANLARATSTTTTAILAGTFVAGDVLAYSCDGYAT